MEYSRAIRSQMIRDIDEGLKTANECFSTAGAVKIAELKTKVATAKEELFKRYIEGDKKAELAFQTMIMTIIMEIYGSAGISNSKLEGIRFNWFNWFCGNSLNFYK